MGSGSPSNLNKMVIFTAMVMVLYYIMVLDRTKEETRPILFVNKDNCMCYTAREVLWPEDTCQATITQKITNSNRFK